MTEPAPTYSAPVRHRGVVTLVAGGAIIAVIAGLGSLRPNSLANTYLISLLISLALVMIAIVAALWYLLPQCIEVAPDEIRLVARRSVSRYVPAEMLLRPQRPGEFAFVRLKTNRTLAIVRPADPDAARDAFAAAGVVLDPRI